MAAWPSGQRVELAIQRCRVRVPLWPLAGSVFGRPELKSLATVNSKLVASCQLGFSILLCKISRVRHLFTKPVLSTILNSLIFSKLF